MRLAGYDWVPETRLTRSLRESWQRGGPGQSQSVGPDTSGVSDSDQTGQWRFQGLCLVTAYMRRFPEKNSNWCCDCSFCFTVLYEFMGHSVNWSELCLGVLSLVKVKIVFSL